MPRLLPTAFSGEGDPNPTRFETKYPPNVQSGGGTRFEKCIQKIRVPRGVLPHGHCLLVAVKPNQSPWASRSKPTFAKSNSSIRPRIFEYGPAGILLTGLPIVPMPNCAFWLNEQ